jgi:membrane protease YdiL (CAAX protease family)
MSQTTIATVLYVAGLAAFWFFAAGTGIGGAELATSFTAFALLFLPYPGLSVKRWRDGLARWLEAAPGPRLAALLSTPLAIYLLYSGTMGTLDFAFIWKYPIFVLGPAALMTKGGKEFGEDPFGAPVRCLVAILILWAPVEFGWWAPFRVPASVRQGIDLSQLVALDVALLIFLVAAPVRDAGFTFRVSAADLGRALMALAVFAAVAIPLGLGIGFISYGWRPFDAMEWGVVALSIYLLVAVPEEFLFRGLLQNLIEKRWTGQRSRLWALLIASVIFGASHLNNGEAPNWRYMLLATFAGLAYGWVWLRTRKVTASAVTHGLVDWIWVVAFRA